MPKVYKSQTLSGAYQWVLANYKVNQSVSQTLRDQLVNGLDDGQMHTMWDRHKANDEIVLLFDELADRSVGIVIRKLGFRPKGAADLHNVREFASLSGGGVDPATNYPRAGYWFFNYNL